mgnify:CR=1 FL=1
MHYEPWEQFEVGFLYAYNIPADSEKRLSEQDQRTQDKTDLATFETDVFGAIFDFYEQVTTRAFTARPGPVA